MLKEKEKPSEKVHGFKSELEQEVSKILSAFFNEEIGNRVTINNIQGLIFRVEKAFNDNKTTMTE